jgi:hypothetical protein
VKNEFFVFFFKTPQDNVPKNFRNMMGKIYVSQKGAFPTELQN